MSEHDADQSPAPVKSDGSIFTRPSDTTPPVEPIPTAPPAPVGQPMTMNSRWRWAVVGVATILVVGLLGAVFVLARPAGGTPSAVARYAPANSATYLELNENLPGDQHGLLAQFMSHFPGFADQAAFDTKLDETMSNLIQREDPGLSWKDQVKTWFGGEVGIFSSTISPSTGTPPSMTAALSVKDRAALDPVLQSWTGSGLSQPSSGALPVADQHTYQGIVIYTLQPDSNGTRVNLAATDDALLIGTRIEDVQAAIDVRADRATGLADDQFFVQQLGALHADRLGTFYFDGRSMAQTLRDQIGVDMPNANMTNWIVDAASLRVIGEVRAEGDHLAINTRAERPANADLPPLPSNRASTLAEAAPKDALVYFEMHDVGQAVSWVINKGLTALPSASGGIPIDLSSMQDLLGSPPQEFFDFIVDASVSVSGTSASPQFGLIASVDDMAIASSRIQKITSLLHMLSQFGGGVNFTDEQHGSATVTVITFSAPQTGGEDVTLAMSLNNGRLMIGTHDFVTGALDRTRDQSLAARPEFQTAVSAGGTSNAGVMFVDIAGYRTLMHDLVPPGMPSAYDLNQAFVAPLNNLSVVNVTDGNTMVSHVFLYVK